MSSNGSGFGRMWRRVRGGWRYGIVAGVPLLILAGYGYAGGWLAPGRLTAQTLIDQFETNGGVHPGYRRNHAKGVCVAGSFISNGALQPYSTAQVFASGSRVPVVGRFALPGGNPYAPDGSVPIRSMALRFTQANGQQWRTGMNSMPVFPVATPQAFYAQLQAQQPDPKTGKPDPAKLAAFFAAHPETAAFRAWAKGAKPSASYAVDSYWSLNAFELVDAQGAHHAVRWRMVPEATDDGAPAQGADFLAADLSRRLAAGPLRWHLWMTFADPGDSTDDATKTWPAGRRDIDAGTLELTATEAQDSGACRDVNYDPLVLPDGIQASDDPLLPARSAAYADSYLRRTSEEAHLPGSASMDKEMHR